ncbi:GNAT family N-acetyltransferase [Heyndrickxia vini]|uniref:GNAT family N-acetyltransferase n=1 Tax=Heyndrickxia vini TaxID=1476025 RepID=A0ABX7DYR3_9BACI|nr:GNAT family N-acetyltransferase [Heyndrickxia vini]QQZ08248.1 GNAT family N-acetyltransferase [Heyndrickxia vini]
MDISIREINREDAETLLHHTQLVFTQSSFLLTTPEEFRLNVEQQREWIIQQSSLGNLLLGCEVNGRIVGFLNASRSQRKRVSHNCMFGISIQKEYWNKGIGRKMLQYMIEWAENHPIIENVSLEVFAHNERAIHLYKSFGFSEVGRKKKHIKFEDGTYVDEILMSRFVK